LLQAANNDKTAMTGKTNFSTGIDSIWWQRSTLSQRHTAKASFVTPYMRLSK
jgi:hypothetical protein